jgi:flagella basal body P-ring formation protein FlgA
VKQCLLGMLMFLIQTFAIADSVQSLDLLKSKIEQYVLNELVTMVEGKININVEKMDSRLRLRACADDKLVIFNPSRTQTIHTNTMGIKCIEADNHWTLYVPIKISVLKLVYAAKQPLSRGSRIGVEDLYALEMDIQQLKQGYYTEEQQVLGKICKQPISQGTPFSPFNVQMPRLVIKGQQVNIVAGNEFFSVKMPGIALNDGILGESVSVKNLSSKKILEGKITASQEVRVLN